MCLCVQAQEMRARQQQQRERSRSSSAVHVPGMRSFERALRFVIGIGTTVTVRLSTDGHAMNPWGYAPPPKKEALSSIVQTETARKRDVRARRRRACVCRLAGVGCVTRA